MIIGSRFEGYGEGHRGGYEEISLDVIPEDMHSPIRTLNFNGSSPVKSGDKIIARIPRYEKIKRGIKMCWQLGEKAYIDRPYKPKETAIEMSILSEDNTILRIDRSVEYRKFFS